MAARWERKKTVSSYVRNLPGNRMEVEGLRGLTPLHLALGRLRPDITELRLNP
jgi:hypothetical protein